MIKTPVELDQKSETVLDADGFELFKTESLYVQEVNEIIKHINLHGELVSSLKHIQCLVALPPSVAKEVNHLLERCKL